MLVTDDMLADLNIPHTFDEPLADKTWFKIGGHAKIYAQPENEQQLSALVKRCKEQNVKTFVLGSGANLLVADTGVDGVVIKLDADGFKQFAVNENMITVGAGYDLMKLVRKSAKLGLSGLQNVAGIPATVGGAIRMNAGGAFGDIGTAVKRVELMDSDGEIYYRDKSDLQFNYRSTNISARFILEVDFELEPDDCEDLTKEIHRIFTYKSSTQPLAANSAGCTFKNPIDPQSKTFGKTGDIIPAGKLIDDAGLKGFHVGGAAVSEHHANFIECNQDCTATDVIQLIKHVQKEVAEKFGIELEREVVIWG